MTKQHVLTKLMCIQSEEYEQTIHISHNNTMDKFNSNLNDKPRKLNKELPNKNGCEFHSSVVVSVLVL